MIHYCPHCWKEILPDAEHCPHCGEATDESGVPFVDRLLATLRHPEPTRAGLAIDLLTEHLHEPRAVEPLIELLTTTHDAAILKQAARGLGLLGDPRAVTALARLLGNADAPYVARREAAFALGKLGGEEAEAALSLALDDSRPSVAEAAHQALKARAST